MCFVHIAPIQYSSMFDYFYRFLLDQGCDINEPGVREIRPIQWATRHQDVHIFELLLERGARAGDLLLMDVAKAGNVQLMKCLKANGNYNLNFKV